MIATLRMSYLNCMLSLGGWSEQPPPTFLISGWQRYYRLNGRTPAIIPARTRPLLARTYANFEGIHL